MDITEGGTSIPYWMEDPFIRKEYEDTLQENGVPSRMKPEWYVTPPEHEGFAESRRRCG
jgi:hypothetical protein